MSAEFWAWVMSAVSFSLCLVVFRQARELRTHLSLLRMAANANAEFASENMRIRKELGTLRSGLASDSATAFFSPWGDLVSSLTPERLRLHLVSVSSLVDQVDVITSARLLNIGSDIERMIARLEKEEEAELCEGGGVDP